MGIRQGSRKFTVFSSFVLIALAFSSLEIRRAHAVSETLVEGAYSSTILPLYLDASLSGQLARPGGVEIDFRAYLHPDARGVILILTGRNETHRKHAETIYDLYSQGYSVFIYDHRGQGNSSHLLLNPQIGHIIQFDDYVDDLGAFVSQVMDPVLDPKLPRYLLAHSLGGAVAARYLEKFGDDRGFSAVAFVTPMFGINVYGFTEAARGLTGLLTKLGLGEHFVPFGGAYKPLKKFEHSNRSHSAIRLRLTEQNLIDHPDRSVGAPSNRWVKESIDATRSIQKHARDLRLPALVVEATQDHSVTRKAEKQICQNAPNCERISLSGAHHEILHESDQYREPALHAILAFFEKNR